MKTIAEQMPTMHAVGFRPLWHDARGVLWEGKLSPTNARDYTVRVAYKTPIMAENFTIGRVQPQVRVMSPLLERHPDTKMVPFLTSIGTTKISIVPYCACSVWRDGNGGWMT